MSIMDTVNIGPVRLVPQSIDNDEVKVVLAIVVSNDHDLNPPRIEGEASMLIPVLTWEAMQEAQSYVVH